MVNGTIDGDPDIRVDRPSRIEEGGEGSISFIGNKKYEKYAYTTSASILLVSQSFQPRQPVRPTLIRVKDVYTCVAFLLERFSGQNSQPKDISDQAFIHEEAVLDEQVGVGPFAVIEKGARIGAGSVIFSQAYVGQDVRIGKNVLIYPGARILQACIIGDHCIIHSNAVIGSDGFGFARQEDKSFRKIPQTGRVIIEDQVEIGANTVIDRGSIGDTIIRAGVKLDNLIQIAHNVEIGNNTALAAQVGVAGSTKIGKGCEVAGQVGFAGHLDIADSTRIQAQSGIGSSVKEAGQSLFGYPAFGYHDFLRSHIIFKKLPELYKKIQELEKRLDQQHDD